MIELMEVTDLYLAGKQLFIKSLANNYSICVINIININSKLHQSQMQYPPNSMLGLTQVSLNRRNHSYYTQSCSNDPPLSHLTSTQPIKHPSSSSQKQHNDKYASHSKENFVQQAKNKLILMNSGDEASQMRRENQRLKRQLQQQKEYYQLEIKKLKKNITLKDQLLDQCEVQIKNLKVSYQRFITQHQAGQAQNIRETNVKSKILQGLTKEKASESVQMNSKVQAALIPLSIMPKRSSSTSQLTTQYSKQKYSHGLIRRIV